MTKISYISWGVTTKPFTVIKSLTETISYQIYQLSFITNNICLGGGSLAFTNGNNEVAPVRERHVYNPNTNSRALINKGSRARIG